MNTDIIDSLFDNLSKLSEWKVTRNELCAINKNDLNLTKLYINIYDIITPLHIVMYDITNNNAIELEYSLIEFYSKVNIIGFITWINHIQLTLLTKLTEINIDQEVIEWLTSDKSKGSGYYLLSDGMIGDSYGPQNENRYMTKLEFYEKVIKIHG